MAWVLIAAGSGEGMVAQNSGSDSGDPVLVGEMSRAEIEEALPHWVDEEILATPDPIAASSLADVLHGVEVTVLLGTWCSDSRRELARLWRALDDAGLVTADPIRYIGVDRGMQEPGVWVAGRDLRLVPTFIVEREGQELGRVVESSPQGIEIDLLALIRGEKTGVVSASDQLDLDEDEE